MLNPADIGHELVLELKGSEHRRARKWLQEHLAQAADMSEDVLASLLGSWAGGWSTAEEVYFKILAEYFKGVVEGLDSEGDDNPMLEFLTDFQREAYVYAKTILRRFGGVFLADVVGLGKTYIALALLNHLQRRHGEHAVVLAPPAVRPAWEELAREFRVELATVSFGKLDDLDKFSDREILVIDESHNFRNVDTLRYDKVQQWLRPEGAASTRKVLLLSATPQNNTADDVKHQLGLFPDNFTRLPFRGESLDAWFREVSAGSASLSEMLQHVVVRRTRRFIQQAHPEATIRVRSAPGVYESRPLQFPKRVSGAEQALRYAIDRTYAGGFYEELLRAIATMRYPLQGLGEYALPASADHPIVRRLRRSGGSVRGLFRVLLLKRLESSLAALNSTLGRLRSKMESAKIAVDKGLVPVGSQSPSEPEDDDGLTGENADHLEITMFDAPRLRQDLDADLLQVRRLVDITARLVERPDEKLARLDAYLAQRPPAQHKTIIWLSSHVSGCRVVEGARERGLKSRAI